MKNGIQKRSPDLHVKCRKAASSGEAMHLQQVKTACTGQISLGCTSVDTLTLPYQAVGVSESHLKKVKDRFRYSTETARSTSEKINDRI